MKKSVKLAVQISFGALCLQSSPTLLAQDKAPLAAGADERDAAAIAPESTPGESTPAAPAPAAAEIPIQNVDTPAVDTSAPSDNEPIVSNAAISQSEAYWIPEDEPPIFIDTTGLEPVEFDDQSPVFTTFAEEEADESVRYQNLRSMSGANAWGGNTMGAAGYAPIGLPNGFNVSPPVFPSGRGGSSILGGLGLAVNLSGTYDSNVTQSSGFGGRAKQDDFITSLGGTLSYMSQARVWTFGGSYTGAYNVYANNSNFDGYTQSGSLIANYDGAKLSATLTTGLSTGRGGNRYLGTSDFIEQTQINVSLAARYVYSPKTILTGDLSNSFSTTEGPFRDTNGSTLGFAALYRYSPLTEIGPGVRFARNAGGGGNVRTSVGPTLNLNYRYSSKLSLNSQIGLNFADYSQIGSSDVSVSTTIGLNYQASPLWGMNLSVFRDAQADPAVPNAFNEVTSVRLGYTRQIRRASLGLGLSYENSTSAVSLIGGTRPNRDYFSIDASLGMQIFANTTNASIFMRYSEQFSGRIESFDAFQVGFMLSRTF